LIEWLFVLLVEQLDDSYFIVLSIIDRSVHCVIDLEVVIVVYLLGIMMVVLGVS
jgi:hypothetical protein